MDWGSVAMNAGTGRTGRRPAVVQCSSAFLSACLVCACGAAPRPVPSGSPPTVDPAEPGLDVGFDAFERALAHAELAVVSTELHVGFLPARERMTVPVRLGAGCTSVVGRAQGIRDLDLALYLPDGTLLAEDTQVDAHPTVQVCGAARSVWVQVAAYAGAGTFELRGYAHDEAALDAFAEVVGGRPGRHRGVNDPPPGAVQRGFGREERRAKVMVAHGVPTLVAIRWTAGRCWMAQARTDQPRSDARLIRARLVDARGGVLVDEAPGALVQLQWCPREDGEGAIEVGVTDPGSVEVQVTLYSGREDEVGGEAGLWQGNRSEGVADEP